MEHNGRMNLQIFSKSFGKKKQPSKSTIDRNNYLISNMEFF